MLNYNSRWLLPALLLLLALPLVACSSKKSVNGGNNNGTPGTAASMAQRINNTRASNGRDALELNAVLAQVAQQQAQINAQRGFNSDSDGSGETVADKLRAGGYNYAVVAYLFNNGTEQRSFDEWRTNPAYSNVLLSSDYTELGVGVASGATQQWWVAIFGSRQIPTSDSAEQMLALLNQIRADGGAAPFVLDPDLTVIAQQQAQYNASIGQSRAVNEDGQSLQLLSEDLGYEGQLIMWTLASGGAESAVDRWTDTPEELLLMLDSRLHDVGIGAAPGDARQWWVVIYTGQRAE